MTRNGCTVCVSDVCQINEVDHGRDTIKALQRVSDVCQINEVDHKLTVL